MKEYKKFIIKKNHEISKLIQKKDSVANKYFIVYKGHNQINQYRYCVSVGTKFGNAVKRNKVKRQIRHIISKITREIKPNYDILIIIRPSANTLTFSELENHLLNVLRKGNLINREEI